MFHMIIGPNQKKFFFNFKIFILQVIIFKIVIIILYIFFLILFFLIGIFLNFPVFFLIFKILRIFRMSRNFIFL